MLPPLQSAEQANNSVVVWKSPLVSNFFHGLHSTSFMHWLQASKERYHPLFFPCLFFFLHLFFFFFFFEDSESQTTRAEAWGYSLSFSKAESKRYVSCSEHKNWVMLNHLTLGDSAHRLLLIHWHDTKRTVMLLPPSCFSLSALFLLYYMLSG